MLKMQGLCRACVLKIFVLLSSETITLASVRKTKEIGVVRTLALFAAEILFAVENAGTE